MKTLKDYLLENAPNKISETGKKKVTKLINKLIKNLDSLEEETGIVHDDADQVDSDCRDWLWNYVEDENICSWSTNDEDSNIFITNEYERLAQAICDKYEL